MRFTKPACNCTGMMCDGLGQCLSSTEQRSTWSCAAALVDQDLHLLSDLDFGRPQVIVEQLAIARNLDGLNNHCHVQQKTMCNIIASSNRFWVWRRVPAGTVDTVLSYCHYSLNDQTLADMIPYLKEKNVGIINASALSMGLLTDQASPGLKACKLAVNHLHYLGLL